MKKAKSKDDIQPEYSRAELGEGVRGKYYSAFKGGHNVVLLDPDVAHAFPSEEAVNEALRSLIKVARDSVDLTNR